MDSAYDLTKLQPIGDLQPPLELHWYVTIGLIERWRETSARAIVSNDANKKQIFEQIAGRLAIDILRRFYREPFSKTDWGLYREFVAIWPATIDLGDRVVTLKQLLTSVKDTIPTTWRVA
ncbi:MAG: hypothetical protein IKZ27_04915 [Kiritimatiellae bacterium]|nr:hypothetical protein [Kiritimatiellia bacterium]